MAVVADSPEDKFVDDASVVAADGDKCVYAGMDGAQVTDAPVSNMYLWMLAVMRLRMWVDVQ